MSALRGVLSLPTVQRVWAIGKPPSDPNVICFFRNLKNVVVMPSVGEWDNIAVAMLYPQQSLIAGERSLASMLAGGDVDG